MAPSRINKRVLTDTSFWFAYYKPKDNHHEAAVAAMEHVQRTQLVFPWPILFETLNSQFLEKKRWAADFDMKIKALNPVLVSDEDYREAALAECLEESSRGGRCLSLVDRVIRMVLDDPFNRIDFLITYDPGDFNDVCIKRQIQIYYIPEQITAPP